MPYFPTLNEGDWGYMIQLKCLSYFWLGLMVVIRFLSSRLHPKSRQVRCVAGHDVHCASFRESMGGGVAQDFLRCHVGLLSANVV